MATAGLRRRPVAGGAEEAAVDEPLDWSKHLFDLAVLERAARDRRRNGRS